MPRPWAIDGPGVEGIGIISQTASPSGSRVGFVVRGGMPTANLLVRAVNAHDALVEALHAFVLAAKVERPHPAWRILIEAGEAALAQAKEVNP